MNKIIISTIAVASIVALPAVSGAISVRTEHRSASGGVTVSEGGAVVTGDQSSSVNVQTIISGTRGRVEVTTEKDGVQTTETHDIQGGTTVEVTPVPPASQDDGGRTPRKSRSTAVAQTPGSAHQDTYNNRESSGASVQVQTDTSVRGDSLVLVNGGAAGRVFAVVDIGHGSLSDSDMPTPVMHAPDTVDMPGIIARLFTRIFTLFGLSA
jgi:hypothetical protein